MPIERICQYCGNHFNISPCKLKNERGKFCSHACADKARIGKPLAITTRQKMSESRKELWRNPGYATKVSLGFQKRWQQSDYRLKMSEIHRQLWEETDYRNMITAAIQKSSATSKHKENQSAASKKMWQDPEFRAKMSKIHKRQWQNPELRVKASQANSRSAQKRWQRLEYKQRQSEAQLQSWQNPEIVAKRLQAAHKRPNNLEQQLIDTLKAFPDFKYNGDFSQGVVLGGLIPDFVNVNGEKQVIELFGDYYHRSEMGNWKRSELGKIMIYNSLGWKCLVIWEHELKELTEKQIINKVESFFSKQRSYAKVNGP